MNDDLEVLVRESIDRLTADSEIPADLAGKARHRVARRQRSVRAAAALGTAAIAAVAAIASALPSAHRQTRARLTAWTVARQADGNVDLTIRQLRDPAGLQRALRADGVLASVTFGSHRHPACRALNASPAPWTVAKQDDGTIVVTISTLSDPGGLQRALRADGVLVSVSFVSHQHPACRALKRQPKPTSS
jgi:hypothetical protein